LKISLIVEGDSDKILFEGQRSWFESLGLELNIIPTYGKSNMIKASMKHYKIALLNNVSNIIFLPDQNDDVCALVTRQKIGIDSKDRAVTIVMKRELEAWILADGKCVRDSTCLQYAPPGQTDTEINPKQRLYNILERKLGFFPTEVEAAQIISPYFSIARAAINNTSAKRFKDFIEGRFNRFSFQVASGKGARP